MSSTSSARELKPASLPCLNPSPSFWLSQPSPFLLSHRTTTDLPSSTDVVIIGSGITGASVVRYLSESNYATPTSGTCKVLMLEARDICYGATGRNGGHCQPLLFDRSPDVADFEVRNVTAVHDYIKAHDIEEWTEWRFVEGCRLFYSQEQFDIAKRDIARLAKEEPQLRKLVKVVDCAKGTVDDLKVKDGIEKVLSEHRVRSGKGDGKGKEVLGLTLTSGAGQLWPYRYVTHIVETLVKDGVLNVQTNTPASKIESINDGEYRQKVTTARGEVKAKHVILATNGYTSHLLPHHFTSLIVPVRCEMSALHPPTAESRRLPNSYGMVAYDNASHEHDDYLIQRPFYPSLPDSQGQVKQKGGHLMFGGGRSSARFDTVGETEDDIVDIGEADYLRKTLPKMLDLIGDGSTVESDAELVASHQWTGIKGYSRDNMPWVGKVPKESSSSKIEWHDGLWLCAGYTGHGMPNATLCGKAIVDMIIAEKESKTKKKGYESICEDVVRVKGLPKTYLISEDRLKAASEIPTVIEQEKMALETAGKSSRMNQKEEKRNCEVM